MRQSFSGIFPIHRLKELELAAKKANCTLTVIGRPGDIYTEGKLIFTVFHGYRRIRVTGDLQKFNSNLTEISKNSLKIKKKRY